MPLLETLLITSGKKTRQSPPVDHCISFFRVKERAEAKHHIQRRSRNSCLGHLWVMYQASPGMYCLCALGIHKFVLSFCNSKNNSLEGPFFGGKGGPKGEELIC